LRARLYIMEISIHMYDDAFFVRARFAA